MEICPSCGRSFPDGTLMNVFVSRGGRSTQQLLCKACGLKAVQGLPGLEVQPFRGRAAEPRVPGPQGPETRRTRGKAATTPKAKAKGVRL